MSAIPINKIFYRLAKMLTLDMGIGGKGEKLYFGHVLGFQLKTLMNAVRSSSQSLRM